MKLILYAILLVLVAQWHPHDVVGLIGIWAATIWCIVGLFQKERTK